jgi:hypothetical protein
MAGVSRFIQGIMHGYQTHVRDAEFFPAAASLTSRSTLGVRIAAESHEKCCKIRMGYASRDWPLGMAKCSSPTMTMTVGKPRLPEVRPNSFVFKTR